MKKAFSLFGKDLSYTRKTMIKGEPYVREYKVFTPENSKRIRIKD